MDAKVKTNNVQKKEKVNFNGVIVYLGIDVHKKNWWITVYVGQHFFKTFHQVSDAKVLVAYLHKNFQGAHYKACYEAGFCGFSVQRALTAFGVECMVVNPSDVPQTHKGTLSKNDASDSKRLGEALAKDLLKPIYVPACSTEADRQLVRYRKKIQQRLKAQKQTLKSLLNVIDVKIPEEHNKPYWTKNFVRWIQNLATQYPNMKITLDLIVDDVLYLRKKLLDTNKHIRSMAESETYAARFKLLTSAPGIGLITAMTMLTEIADIDRFDSFARFNSFIGLCPSEFSSGESVRKGKLTIRSHNTLRSLILEAAWVAIRVDPALTLKFNELTQTKTKKRAIVIIARKLLSRIFTVWKKQTEYENGIIK